MFKFRLSKLQKKNRVKNFTRFNFSFFLYDTLFLNDEETDFSTGFWLRMSGLPCED